MNNFCVYALLDPRKNYLPFYIGKGKVGRWNGHLKEKLETTKNKLKCHTINKIKEAGLEVTILVWKSNLDENTAYALETELILRFGRKLFDLGGILTNIVEKQGASRSGQTNSQKTRDAISQANRERVFSDETREKHRVNAKQRYELSVEFKEKFTAARHLSHKHSEETKEKIRQAKLGKTASQEAKDKMSLARKGRKATEATKSALIKSNIDRVWSDESKEKLRQAHTGRICSDEQRRKTSEAVKSRSPEFWEEHARKMRESWKRRKEAKAIALASEVSIQSDSTSPVPL